MRTERIVCYTIHMPTIQINLDPLFNVASDPLTAAWYILANGAWVIALWAFLWMAWRLWLWHLNFKHIAAKLHPVLLAIDVPKLTVQTPKGIENFFAHLAGAHGTANRREKYITGMQQEWFSFEIVSIEGYIQFLVWTWDKFRDLIETAIYAQYPDAQITEIQDYTTEVPMDYPNKEWDCFGTEFVLVRDQAYPLRTWEMFEHKGQKDEPFKDPLAALLENMARIGPGEQIWFQILVMPIGQEWKVNADKIVKKLIGAKIKAKKTIVDTAFEMVGAVTGPIFSQLGLTTEEAVQKKDEPLSKMLFLSAGERTVAEAVEKKLSKIGFNVKIRAIYVGRKEVFKKPRGAHAVIGAIKQFNTNDMNALKPDYKRISPSSLFWFKNYRNNLRKRLVIRAFRQRSMWAGVPAYILNTEELATLWHFPTVAVHTPLIRKSEAKRAEPPSSLPVAGSIPTLKPKSSDLPTIEPPEGLPIVK